MGWVGYRGLKITTRDLLRERILRIQKRFKLRTKEWVSKIIRDHFCHLQKFETGIYFFFPTKFDHLLFYGRIFFVYFSVTMKSKSHFSPCDISSIAIVFTLSLRSIIFILIIIEYLKIKLFKSKQTVCFHVNMSSTFIANG